MSILKKQNGMYERQVLNWSKAIRQNQYPPVFLVRLDESSLPTFIGGHHGYNHI